MSLLERLAEDIKTAQRAGEAVRLETLRFLSAQIKNREIEKRGAGASSELTDEDVQNVIQRESKKRREAIELYRSGGRADLAEKEAAELTLLEVYLPAQVSLEEITAVVDRLIAGGAPREFNTLMKVAMAELKGRADGKIVGEVVRTKVQ